MLEFLKVRGTWGTWKILFFNKVKRNGIAIVRTLIKGYYRRQESFTWGKRTGKSKIIGKYFFKIPFSSILSVKHNSRVWILILFAMAPKVPSLTCKAKADSVQMQRTFWEVLMSCFLLKAILWQRSAYWKMFLLQYKIDRRIKLDKIFLCNFLGFCTLLKCVLKCG